MRFLVLGPVRILARAGEPVGSSIQRQLVSLLLSRAGRPVPAEVLADELWPGEGAPLPRLQTQVHRLRKVLDDPERIEHEQGTYRLRPRPGEHDAERFERLHGDGLQALAANDPQTARDLLREAVELWRGPAYADVDLPSVRAEAARLDELRVDTLEAMYDAELATGSTPTAELKRLTEEHPLRERFAAQLMITLHQGDRQAEALAVYQQTRDRLVAELGVEPGRELRRIQSSILAEEPPVLGVQPVVVPQQVPPGVERLYGRDAELAVLDEALAPAPKDSTEPGVVIVTGPAGVGKTTLALHWAHLVRDRFPDGRLYVDLHGYSAGEPSEPATVIGRLLRDLGVPDQRIPATADERSALLRSLTARRRMLIVLDNVRDTAQVKTLLPGPGPVVVITGRTRLTGLAARHRVHRLELAELDESSAVALLGRRLPANGTVQGGTEALTEIAAICGRLPLALTLAAEKVERGPDHLAGLLDDLRDERGRLDELAPPDDPDADVRVVLSWSYRALPKDAWPSRLFPLLALCPDSVFRVPAVAALGAVSEREARLALDTLCSVNLLRSPEPRTYQVHDLVRLYAAELLTELGPNERAAASDRLGDWYARSAENARRAIQPFNPVLSDRSGVPGVVATEFGDLDAALGWFDQERESLGRLLPRLVADGNDQAVVQLAVATAVHLNRRSSPAEAVQVLTLAAAAAERLGDRAAEASIANRLGNSQSRAADYPGAIRSLERAVRLFAGLEDRFREAIAEGNLGLVLRLMGDPEAAATHQARSLELHEVSGTANDQAVTLNNLAMAYLDLGRTDEAVTAARRAVEIHAEAGDRDFEGYAADTLATAYAARGEYDDALRWFERSLEIARDSGDRWIEADSLRNLGLVLRDAGRAAEARTVLARALWLLDDLDAPDNAKLSRSEITQVLRTL
ncbi:DNA-binding SARP family transcriptional activator [Kribbella amoyensis]|uniref:DNA-binding SARP family transcriptional activator n=1 Tax=Kribbella amoyensis TaxID=996641 RepID=A0A561BW42_9ACTN|nr:AfsR/SARP family transcriptional regulator [Kribbella amoyensis]TWD83099.1 DNA-binding SARP family transcriptional activator [Kribbella amoyensis]